MPPDESFHHEAFFYADLEEFLAGATAFIHDGLAAGEPMMVAVRAHQIAALRAELGDDLPGVRFVDMPTLGRNPARIIPAWRRFVAEHGPGAPGLRGIGEPIWPGRGPAELVECRLHEALLNLAFGPAGGPAPSDRDPSPSPGAGELPPFRLMCPYDTSALDASVLEQACGTHPFLRRGGAGDPSHRYEVDIARLLDDPLPEPRGRPAELAFDRTLVHLRRFVADQAAQIAGDRLDRRTGQDLVLAMEELAANSVRHGGGGGVARIWREDDTLLCEVRDRGHITDPLAGRYEPDQQQVGGRGLWLVNQLCDLLQIRSSPEGTVTRLHLHLARDG